MGWFGKTAYEKYNEEEIKATKKVKDTINFFESKRKNSEYYIQSIKEKINSVNKLMEETENKDELIALTHYVNFLQATIGEQFFEIQELHNKKLEFIKEETKRKEERAKRLIPYSERGN